jgi:hypothetical protein
LQDEDVAVTAGRSRGVDENGETTGVEQRHARQVDHDLSGRTLSMAAHLHGGEQPAKCG